MTDWVFDPTPPSGAKKGGLANAQVFDPEIDSFVREVLQNARDQKLKDADGVDVRIALRQLEGEALGDLLSVIGWDRLSAHLEAAATQGGITMSERLHAGIEVLNEGRLRVMVIEDFGTRGLIGAEDAEESNFNALCRHELITSSERRDSGGSFGIGKSVLWRFSNLSTVLFGSWLSDEEEMRFFGRTLLPSHRTADGSWDGSGWYGDLDLQPSGPRAVSIRGDRAAELATGAYLGRDPGQTGTSILVLGFDEPALADDRSITDVCEALVKSSARWFWPGLARGDMHISVEGWENDQQAFMRHVAPTEPEILPFVEAQKAAPETDDSLDGPGETAEREIGLSIPAQRRVPDGSTPKPAIEAAATLRIRYAESSETEHLNTVALQRGTGMVVQYRDVKVRSDIGFGFHAVLEVGKAHGDTDADRSAEEFFRAAEPPAHTEWTHKTERIKAEYLPGSKATLERLFAALEQAVRDYTRQETVATDEGPDALRKLFPLPGVGPGEPVPAYRLKDASAAIDGSQWSFEGTFCRADTSDDRWLARVRLILDQESGGSAAGGILIPVDGLESQDCKVSGPQSDGSYLLDAAPSAKEVRFSGRSAPIDSLPDGGLNRVRLRLDVRSVSDGGAK